MTTTKGSGYSNGRRARHGSAQLIAHAHERTDACVVTDMNTMRLLFAVKKKQHDKDKGEIEREWWEKDRDRRKQTDRQTHKQ